MCIFLMHVDLTVGILFIRDFGGGSNAQNVLQLRQSARMRAPGPSGFLQCAILLGGESPRAVSPVRRASRYTVRIKVAVTVAKCDLDTEIHLERLIFAKLSGIKTRH